MATTPRDLNRGIRAAHDALARRLARMAGVNERALRSLGRRVSSVLSDLGTWIEPEAIVAELRRRVEAAWLGRHTGEITRVRAEAWRVGVGEISASLGVRLDLSNPVLEGAFRTLANRTDLAEGAWEMVREGLQKSYDEGLSIPHAARELQTRVASLSPARATLIARTEMTGMTNAGSIGAARITGAAEWKQWLASDDGRTREAHQEAAGQTVPLDDTFSVGGEELDYPGDPSGSAANVANCRCTVIYAEGPEGFEGELGPSALLGAFGGWPASSGPCVGCAHDAAGAPTLSPARSRRSSGGVRRGV